jgi:hypothetical protein
MVRTTSSRLRPFARWLAVVGLLTGCAEPRPPTHRKPSAYYQPAAPSIAVANEAVTPIPTDQLLEPSTPTTCDFAEGQLFHPTAPWNTPVDALPTATDSFAVTQYLHDNHTASGRFQTDFSFVVQPVTTNVPLRTFTPTEDHYLPDCDIGPLPVPQGGRIEGESGYECKSKGDCHLLVHVPEQCKLYEMWRANVVGNTLFGGCMVEWDTRMNYGTTGRGKGCTSADASGLPITPLLFTPEDLLHGRINHAIRLVLPNSLIRRHVYVFPATHSTPPTSGPAAAPPYGARFRLRADFDTSHLSSGAKVVAAALKRYGMILVDGGELSFTTVSDRERSVKWSTVEYSAKSLTSLRWTDFELVEAGPRITWTGECVRN